MEEYRDNNARGNETDHSTSNVEFVDMNYSGDMVRKEFRRKLFPFSVKGKSHYYGLFAFITAVIFFAVPGIVSILAMILPRKNVLNYIATQTSYAFTMMAAVMGVVALWLLIGRIVECCADKKPFLPYDSFKDFVKKNVVRILFFVVIILMTVSSLVNTENTVKAFTNQTDGVFIWYLVAVAALLISLVKDKKQQRILLIVFSVSALLTCIIMFMQYVLYYKKLPLDSFSDFINLWSVDFSKIETTVEDLRQLRGVFANSNHYGYFLTLSSLATAGLYVTGDKLWKRILSALAFAVFMFTMVLNDTLGSQLAIVLIIVLLPVAFIKSKAPVYRRFVPLAVMVCVMAFMSAFPQLPIGSMAIRNSIDELKTTIKKVTSYNDIQPEEEPTLPQTSELAYRNGRTGFALLGKTTSTAPADKPSSASYELSEMIPAVMTSDNQIMISEDTEENSESAEGSAMRAVSETPEITAAAIEAAKEDDRWWLKNQEIGTSRLGLWQYGIHLMSQKPILGYGVYGTKDMFYNESGLSNPAGRVHNEYLQIGIDCGIPAMLIHIIAYIGVVIYFFRGMKKGTLTDLQRVMFTMFAAYAVSAFMGICAYYTASYFYIWLGLLISTFEGSFTEYPKYEPEHTEEIHDAENEPHLTNLTEPQAE